MEVTFLREEDIWGDNALEVIKAYGTRVGISDAAIALGTHMNRNSDDKDITGVASGHSWLTSFHISGDVHIVYYYGTEHCIYPSGREAAGRPAIPASVTSAIRPKNVKEEHLANGKTVQICEYGEYPKTVAPKPVSQELETLYRKKNLKTTGRTYTFDSAELRAYDTGFIPRNCAEYRHNGKKYVRIEGKPFDDDSILSDGTSVQKGQAYWFEVQPVEWLMDPKGTWVARQALFAGIQFDTKEKYDGNFANTAMKHYLDHYFVNEMRLERTEQMTVLKVRNELFSNYVSGMGDNKTFYPGGKNGNPFTPEQAKRILSVTNYAPFMRDTLKLIAAFPKDEQCRFKDVVLAMFEAREQPIEVKILGKKLAVSSGYETELNEELRPKEGQVLRSGHDEKYRWIDKEEAAKSMSASRQTLSASDIILGKGADGR